MSGKNIGVSNSFKLQISDILSNGLRMVTTNGSNRSNKVK